MTKSDCKCGAQLVHVGRGRIVENVRHSHEECIGVGALRARKAEAAKLGTAPKLGTLARVEVVMESAAVVGASVRGPDDLVDVLRAVMPGDRECFVVVMLNARHEATGYNVVSVGSLNASIVHPREVFKAAVLANAASVVLAHNHPSGDPEPSEEDMSITRRLVEVGELMGIGVLDHIVIGDPKRGVVSFRARQLL